MLKEGEQGGGQEGAHQRELSLLNATSSGARGLHVHPSFRGRRGRVLPRRIDATGDVTLRVLSLYLRYPGGFGRAEPGPALRVKGRGSGVLCWESLEVNFFPLKRSPPSPACISTLGGARPARERSAQPW